MSRFPSIQEEGTTIRVDFGPSPSSSIKAFCEFVLDYNAMGNVIGIEIINLRLHAGQYALGTINRCLRRGLATMTYAYDDESDSFYLQFEKVASVDQKAVDGVMTLNQRGEIVSMFADAT